MRQTSGALRRTEGSWRPRSARTTRKSLRREAVAQHITARNTVAREILRLDRHLRCMRDAVPRDGRSRRRRIRNRVNGLSSHCRIRIGRTLTARPSLEADLGQNGFSQFSLRQSGDEDVAPDGSGKSRLPWIFRSLAARR
jgi:hypothetical protein